MKVPGLFCSGTVLTGKADESNHNPGSLIPSVFSQLFKSKDGITLAPNHVYLNPPGKNVTLFDRCLHLLDPVKTTAVNLPIDFFFRSLSEDQGEKAIGIILSGTASDGTMGIRTIKGGGGMAMVQEPDTAKYDGMPKSAIETGLVDFIAPVERMPEILIRYVEHPFHASLDKTKRKEPFCIDPQRHR